MIAGVARLAELAAVTGRAPAFLHVHCQLARVPLPVSVTRHGSRQSHVVDETET